MLYIMNGSVEAAERMSPPSFSSDFHSILLLTCAIAAGTAAYFIYGYYKNKNRTNRNQNAQNISLNIFSKLFSSSSSPSSSLKLGKIKTGVEERSPSSRSKLSSSTSLTTCSSTPCASSSAAAGVSSSSSFFVLVYFGSQTGTAESFAREIAKDMQDEYDIDAEAVDLEDFDEREFYMANFVVFVVATYGEGEPTDNAVQFFNWLNSEEVDTGGMKGKKYAVMGLGNRQYTNFNAMGRKTDELLQMHGAVNVCPRGEADDDEDTESDFCEWKKPFWDTFKTDILPKQETNNEKNEHEGGELDQNEEEKEKEKVIAEEEKEEEKIALHHQLTWKDMKRAHLDMIISETKIIEEEAEVEEGEIGEGEKKKEITGYDIQSKLYFQSVKAKIIHCYELRQKPDYDKGASTFHIELEVPPGCLEPFYMTADNLDIFPHNPSHLVEWFGERLRLKEKNLHINFHVKFISRKIFEHKNHQIHETQNLHHFPTPSTIREVLTRYCDLTSIPPKSILRDLSCFLKNEKEKENYDALLSDEATHEFKMHIRESGMCFMDFVKVFMKSAEFDVEGFLQLIQRQRPRPYTVSSSACSTPGSICIAVSKVHFNLAPLYPSLLALQKNFDFEIEEEEEYKKKRTHFGLCSSFLCDENLQHKIKYLDVLVRKSTFRLPRDPLTPIVMIAAGTGLAPFRAFLLELKYLREQNKEENSARGENILFFGCTHSERDFIYKNDLLELAAQNEDEEKPPILDKLVCAFSREQEHKVYVQHRIMEEKKIVWDLIERGAIVYLCGGMGMGRSAVHTIEEISKEHNADPDFIRRLRKSHHIVEELWA